MPFTIFTYVIIIYYLFIYFFVFARLGRQHTVLELLPVLQPQDATCQGRVRQLWELDRDRAQGLQPVRDQLATCPA